MAYLNQQALQVIADALNDATDVYERLVECQELVPVRLRSQFSAQRHMAKILAAVFEELPAINVETVNTADYKALIWEK